MTDDQIIATMLWRSAIARMAALNTELAQLSPTTPTLALYEMRVMAESRLTDYFVHVERMIACNPIPDTPGDRKRQAA